ncbi:hypothetical protein H0V99_03670 [Candidatus Saccharibacteria bacterium]|nr:hypothetical protein [Candidatus Saccharibacteria bacterium]
MSRIKDSVKKASKNSFLVFGLVALMALGTGFAGVQALSNNQNKQVSNQNCNANVCLALTETGIKPDNISVKLGEFVQFNSADGRVHNMSLGEGKHGQEDDGHGAHADVSHQHEGEYQSGDFEADEAWRVQFNQTGVFYMHDHYNPDLFVTVIVYEPGVTPRLEV